MSKEQELTPEEVRVRALSLLARREHSRLELQRKLTQRGFPQEMINAAIDLLAAENLQSDLRFAEQYAYQRMTRGFGPVRIRAELRERGIDGEGVQQAFDSCEVNWRNVAIKAREKRFGPCLPAEVKEQQRQTRFLQQRGFQQDHIRQIMKNLELA